MKFSNSLWAKLSLGVVLMIVIIMSAVTYVLTLSQIKEERIELRHNMARVARLIASMRFAETKGWYVYQDWIDNIVESDLHKDIVYIAIFDEKDSLAAFAVNTSWLEMGDSNYLTRSEQAEVVRTLSHGGVAEESRRDFDNQVVDIKWGDELLGRIDVGFSLIDFNNAIRRRLLINLALLTLFSFIGVIGSVIMSHRITRPLNDLSVAMQAVSRGDLDQHLQMRRKDEIGKLANSFNEMLKGLKEKSIIEKFGRDLSFTFELDKVSKLVTRQIVRAMNARDGLLFLIEKEQQGTVARLVSSDKDTSTEALSIKIDDECYQAILHTTQPTPINHFDKFAFFQEIRRAIRQQPEVTEIRLVAPLGSKNSLYALLLLGPNAGNNGEYSDKEIDFLATLSTQASLAIENAQLLSQLTEQERIKKELEIARSVQMRLLPDSAPHIDGMDICGICIPAEEIGGDYYDYFLLDQNKIGIAITDVSGKGISAAFYMAEIKGMMSSLAFLLDSPKELLSVINQRLFDSMDRRMFATMIYAVIDVKKKKMTFVRAGHNPLIIQRKKKNSAEFLIPSGLGIGLTRNELFEKNLIEQTVRLHSGDLLLFFTDGISEAMNAGRTEFGEKRLADCLQPIDGYTANDILNRLLADVNHFAGQAPQHDDMTLVLAKIS